ncbi:hypothetical protein AAC387_Pa02g4780 [Persea americana]
MSVMESDENILDTMCSEHEPKRKRKHVSLVWSEYEKLPLDADGKQRAKCNRCGKKYITDYGTTNLKRHLVNCPRRDGGYAGQLLLPSTEPMTPHSSKLDQEKFREMVAKAVIRHGYPFEFVEHEGFRDLCSFLNPDAKPISRNDAEADILKMYKKHKEKLHHLLQSVSSRICLTLEFWKSITTDYDICLTAHFIDEEWVLQKRILSFSLMQPPHSSSAIAERVSTLLNEWGIEKKLFSITLDNASSNDALIEVMKNQTGLKNALLSDGQFFHVHCCVHILNLLVQEGLKEVDAVVNKIRETVKYLKNSQPRKTKLLDCVSQLSLQGNKGLHQDVPTKWNTTYLMLESAILYRPALCQLQSVDSNYKDCPSPEEWNSVEKIVKFLKCFYDVTNTFSRAKHLTADLYFHGVWKIQLHLKEEMESVDSFISKLATEMHGKFDKYWKDYSPILAIAVILDPRYKMQFVEFSYKKLYGQNFTGEVTRVHQHLHSLFNEYLRHSSEASASNVSAITHQSGCNDVAVGDDVDDDLKDFDTFKSQFSTEGQKSQLDLYLQEPKLDRKQELDILNYWKSCKYWYPELSQMARDILAIPVSAVASEAMFSVGGKVLDQFHSVLTPQNIEALICSRDWLFGIGVDCMEMKTDDIVKDILRVDASNDASHGSNDFGL